MGPPAGDAQGPGGRPVAGVVPQRVQDSPGNEGRQQDDEVPQPDLARQEREHDDRQQRAEEDQQCGVDVVEEAGHEREPGRKAHLHRPQAARADDAHVPGAPAVLLAHERVHPVGADAGGQDDGHIPDGPAVPHHVEPRVHVLGVGDQGRAALRLQRGPPVHRRGPDAGGRAEAVAADLDGPVEHLLHRPGRVLQPRLVGTLPEELGGLDDGQGRVVHIGQGLGQEVGPGHEVGVQDEDELAGGLGKGVAQVAALLVHPLAGPPDVGQPEGGGQVLGLVRRPVVEDVRLDRAGVGGQQRANGCPGVPQHLDRLAADRQENVHAGIGRRTPRLDESPMGRHVEAAPAEVHRQADHLVQRVAAGENHERPERRLLELEAQLADDQAGGADGQDRGQVGQIPVQIAIFLGVAGRRWQDELRARGRRGRARFRRGLAGGGHEWRPLFSRKIT